MQVRTSCPVERILVEDGRAVGIRLEGGEEIRAKIVIANATARTIFTRLLIPDPAPSVMLLRMVLFAITGPEPTMAMPPP